MKIDMIENIRFAISKEFWNQNWSTYGLAKEARIDQRALDRFLFEDKTVKLENLCKVCEAMGLELEIRKKEK